MKAHVISFKIMKLQLYKGNGHESINDSCTSIYFPCKGDIVKNTVLIHTGVNLYLNTCTTLPFKYCRYSSKSKMAHSPIKANSST